MKKITALIITAIMILSFTACGEDSSKAIPEATAKQNAITEESSTSKTQAETRAEIGDVIDTSATIAKATEAATTTTETTPAEVSVSKDKEQMIFHCSEYNDAEDRVSGVLIYLNPSNTEGQVSYNIMEYLDEPGIGNMFEQYGATDGEYSDNMSLVFERVEMRNTMFDSDGYGILEIEGTNEITVSGDTLYYHAYGTVPNSTNSYDYSYNMTRVTPEFVNSLINW